MLFTFLPLNSRASDNTHHSKFRAISTRPLFMCNTHHPLFMCNTHQFEFRTIRTNLNSVQIQTRPLFTCETYQSFFYEQDVPIQITCNTHRYCIHVQNSLVFFHVQYAPVLIHMQYASIFYSWAIRTICISWAIRTNIHGLYTPYSHFWGYTQS